VSDSNNQDAARYRSIDYNSAQHRVDPRVELGVANVNIH